MARTSGHGNPNWTRDETILALDLYLSCGDRVPGQTDERVIALSQELRRYPFHENASRQPSFRNPDGVAFKLQNIRQVATGKGLGNTSSMDRKIWAEMGNYPAEVAKLAQEIRRQIIEFEPSDTDEEIEFPEGRILTRAHRVRERNPNLRNKLLEVRRSKGPLSCEICHCQAPSSVVDLEDAIFEAHHNIPIAQVGPSRTKLSDVSLLCANCHRLLHKMIARSKKWLHPNEVRASLSAD